MDSLSGRGRADYQGIKSSAPSPGIPAKKSNDMGDVFELSQLLFVVGHIAVKQVSYLELIE